MVLMRLHREVPTIVRHALRDRRPVLGTRWCTRRWTRAVMAASGKHRRVAEARQQHEHESQ